MESNSIGDIKGAYGVVLYMNEEHCETAMEALDR